MSDTLTITREQLLEAVSRIEIPRLPQPEGGVIRILAESVRDALWTALAEEGAELRRGLHPCGGCLWDITDDGNGRWRLGWATADDADPYRCDGSLDQKHTPRGGDPR